MIHSIMLGCEFWYSRILFNTYVNMSAIFYYYFLYVYDNIFLARCTSCEGLKLLLRVRSWALNKMNWHYNNKKMGKDHVWLETLGCWPLQIFGFFFMIFKFYWLDLHNKSHILLANLRWHICKNPIENWTSFDLILGIGSACLLDS